GGLVGTGRAAHPTTPPPRSEQDPGGWGGARRSAMTSALGATRRAGVTDRVAAVSVAGQQHGLVVCDQAAQPLRSAKLWNDTESAPEAAQLVRERGAEWWATTVGSVPVASFTVTKVAWLAAHQPEVLAATDRLVLPHDWITWRLCGRAVTDRGDASGTGYWSPADERWRPDVLALACRLGTANGDTPAAEAEWWSGRLPEVLGPADPPGTLTDAAAEDLGLEHGSSVMVGPGTGDNMGAALGVGLRPGDVVISIGTSGTVYARSSHSVADTTGAVAGFADATGHWLPLVCTLNATKVTDAVRRLLDVDHQGFDALVSSAPAGADGLTLVPYFDGERTPDLPDATGLLTGLRSDVQRPQLARAATEGVICGLLEGLDALLDAGVTTPERLLVVGGGARSDATVQTLADLAGLPVVRPAGDEHVALGACVQAAAVLDGSNIDDVQQRWSTEHRPLTVEPALSGATADEIRARHRAERQR
ncbi:MAG: xylulokinase, partial [Acidimicrobiia bacterium]|nr:xylulokinase [Acidimicrobiia bacterium]